MPPGVPGVVAANGPYSGGNPYPLLLKNSGVAPVGATPIALMASTCLVLGLYIKACVSPPQLNTSHMVHVAASIAHAASTALPPLSKTMEPAVAAKGLPVIAIQFLPCNGGFCVCCANKKLDTVATNKSKQSFFINQYFSFQSKMKYGLIKNRYNENNVLFSKKIALKSPASIARSGAFLFI